MTKKEVAMKEDVKEYIELRKSGLYPCASLALWRNLRHSYLDLYSQELKAKIIFDYDIDDLFNSESAEEFEEKENNLENIISDYLN